METESPLIRKTKMIINLELLDDDHDKKYDVKLLGINGDDIFFNNITENENFKITQRELKIKNLEAIIISYFENKYLYTFRKEPIFLDDIFMGTSSMYDKIDEIISIYVPDGSEKTETYRSSEDDISSESISQVSSGDFTNK